LAHKGQTTNLYYDNLKNYIKGCGCGVSEAPGSVSSTEKEIEDLHEKVTGNHLPQDISHVSFVKTQ
jgi:hypothetical protein